MEYTRRLATVWRRRLGATVALLVIGGGATVAGGSPIDPDDRRELLERVELGMLALTELGHGELAQRLEPIVHDLRETLAERERGETARRQRDAIMSAHDRRAASVRDQLREVEQQLEHAAREAEMAKQVIPKLELDLARRGDDVDVDRLRELLDEYRKRAAAAEDHSAALRAHGAELRRALRRAEDETRRVRRRAERENRGPDRRGPERQADADRESATRQLETLEIMRTALHALLEADRHDLAHLLELGIHARELELEGRRDPEAKEIRERAPAIGMQIEVLQHAAGLWREFGHEHKSDLVNELAERLAAATRGRRDRSRRDDGRREREVAIEQIEIMRSALPALREGGRRDAADLLERGIRVRELALEGHADDPETRALREGAPDRAQIVELLRFAAELWREFDDAEKAEGLDALARQMWSRRGERRERREGRRGEDEMARRVEMMQEQLREMRHAIDAMLEELEGLK